MNKLVALMLLLTIISCGKKSGGSSAVASKSMFSSWTSGPDTIDFTGYTLGTSQQEVVTFANGAICDFDSTLTGTSTSALWLLNNGVYRAATGPGDPGCNIVNDTYQVTLSGATLTICDPPGYTVCTTYN